MNERDRQRAEQAAEKERQLAERDRQRAAEVAEKERVAAERQAARLERDRQRLEEAAEREAAARRREHERAVDDAAKEAAQAQRDAERAALDAQVKAQRAARQAERARLRAEAAGLTPERPADLPPPLAALWRTTEGPRRGPRPTLTLDGITAAAITLADAEGLRAVSMARVAEALGVTTMALYRYVTSKDELLGLMYDAALADEPGPGVLAPPPADAPPWRARLHAWCDRQLALTVRHPWLMQAVDAIPALGPRRVRMLEAGLETLAGTPLTAAQRVEVVGAASLLMLSEGILLAAALTPAPAPGAQPAGAAAHPALVDFGALLRLLTTPEEHPRIWEGLEADAFDDDVAAGDGGATFRVELMLDGVARLVAEAGSGAVADAAGGDD